MCDVCRLLSDGADSGRIMITIITSHPPCLRGQSLAARRGTPITLLSPPALDETPQGFSAPQDEDEEAPSTKC